MVACVGEEPRVEATVGVRGAQKDEIDVATRPGLAEAAKRLVLAARLEIVPRQSLQDGVPAHTRARRDDERGEEQRCCEENEADGSCERFSRHLRTRNK